MKTVTAQLAGMRKPQEFVIYPFKPGEGVTVQSERAIGAFDPVDCKGLLNWRGSHAKYFFDLMKIRGAEVYTFPREFVDECVRVQPQSGDEVGPGVIIG